MANTTRAKFTCNSKRQNLGPDNAVQSVEVSFTPVYSSDKASENYSFWQNSPSGSISMTITNMNAVDLFEIGKEYYIDFTPAK